MCNNCYFYEIIEFLVLLRLFFLQDFQKLSGTLGWINTLLEKICSCHQIALAHHQCCSRLKTATRVQVIQPFLHDLLEHRITVEFSHLRNDPSFTVEASFAQRMNHVAGIIHSQEEGNGADGIVIFNQLECVRRTGFLPQAVKKRHN